MSLQSSSDTGRRVATAFFDSRDAAEAAQRDLAAAGFHPETVALTGGETRHDDPILPEDGGFWHALKEFFMPDQDRYTYAEGLRRGGVVLSVTTTAADYPRAIDILDADGAVDIDERERDWQAEGWTGWQGAAADEGAIQRPDNSTAGFGASYAGEDGYQPPQPGGRGAAPLTTEGGADAESRADPTRVAGATPAPGTLNPDMRERIGAGTASMRQPIGPDDATRGNAADFDRKAAVEDASLGSPTRAAAEAPQTTSTIGSTMQDRDDLADPWTARRDPEIGRARVRGFILDPKE